MPYGYFQLVRFIAFVGFIYLAFDAKQRNEQNIFIIFVVLALLFQPFFKVALGRTLWNIVDVVVGICLIISAFKKPEKVNEL
ncbi:hypothetical protein OVA16_12060 [Pedobacter sp. SL55]|nr:hypothetical protein OVA16_12060 [Pedobacter sp. SL55]